MDLLEGDAPKCTPSPTSSQAFMQVFVALQGLNFDSTTEDVEKACVTVSTLYSERSLPFLFLKVRLKRQLERCRTRRSSLPTHRMNTHSWL